jgi:ATP synthase protein I
VGEAFVLSHFAPEISGIWKMSDKDERSELDKFDTRLKQAQESSIAPRGLKAPTNEPPKGLGLALRCGADLVSGLAVGVGIGYALDTYVFDTKPWLMVLFFFLGAAAGIMNVFRTVQGLGLAVGYKDTPPRQTGKDDNLKD